jgi:peptidoglycan/xylan/chitin deacetylase (PgdA/CDA1 family)
MSGLAKLLARYPALRSFARWLWAAGLRATGGLRWAERSLRASNATVVLMFHRVVDDDTFRKTCSLPGTLVRKPTFERLAAYLAKRFAVVPLTDAPAAASKKLRMAITFDDGWADNREIALPIAAQHGLPLTVFICPAAAGTTFPFWPEKVVAVLRASGEPRLISEAEGTIAALKRRKPAERDRWLAVMERTVNRVEMVSEDRVLSREEIREMAAAGVRFGSHTQTHSLLTGMAPEAAQQEIRASKQAIEHMLGGDCEAFSYPNGDWSPEIRRMVEEAGYLIACTTDRGVWTQTTDPLAIPRANVSEEDLVAPWGGFSPALFGYTTYWKAWRAERRNRLAQRACTKASGTHAPAEE